MPDEPKTEPPSEKSEVVEKKKPLDQKVKEIDRPPGGPATVVVPPG